MTRVAPSICVMIAAWNAEETIARAVRSALDQAEVAEVVVVDDASTDATAMTARSADDGTGRLRVMTQPENRGPAAARNTAIEASSAPYLTILDSDDFLLPNRFAPLLAVPNWDAIADNILFIPEDGAGNFDAATVHSFEANPTALSFRQFVAGNIVRRGKPRGELGFIKPVLRRAFLERHGLGYDETLRLGEDFALYARILAAGGRFALVRSCGYVAVERRNSLSGQHATADLAALLASDDALATDGGLAAADSAMLRRHRAQLAIKVRHRRFLDDKRAHGMVGAVRRSLVAPEGLPGIAGAIFRDKLAGMRPIRSSRTETRYLLPA